MSILAYHMVDSRFDWGITRVTPGQFRRQVELALKRGFTFHTITDYLAQPDETKRLALTFDDGYESVYHNAFPILKRHGLCATLFISPAYIGQMNKWDVNIGWLRFRHLDWHQIREMAEAGWEIGSHGMTHRDLTRLDDSELDAELAHSRKIIQRRTGQAVHYLSYPFGNADPRVIRICMEHGYRGGLVMARRIRKVPEAFTVPRIGVYLTDPLKIFEQKLFTRNQSLYRFLQSCLDICSDGTVLVKQGFRFSTKNKLDS